MSALRGARARARAEIATAIKNEARRQLAEDGAVKLSLRAVARQLGVASSALYRYFASRDELLTALILDAYHAVGAAAEEALRESVGVAPMARWLAIGRAVRSWALAHPHEYALIYGTPVPGYVAPPETAAAASRSALALISVLREAEAAGLLQPQRLDAGLPEGGLVCAPLGVDLRRLRAEFGEEPDSRIVTEAIIVSWTMLFGLISFELFGHYHRVVDERDAFFDHTMAWLGRTAGLPPLAAGA